MKLHKVLEKLSGSDENWFRPVSWKGRKEAFTFKDGMVALVPTLYGGEVYMTANPIELMSDWEIVSTDTVLNGK